MVKAKYRGRTIEAELPARVEIQSVPSTEGTRWFVGDAASEVVFFTSAKVEDDGVTECLEWLKAHGFRAIGEGCPECFTFAR